MKKINILYWIFTGLLAALMFASAVPSILNNPQSHDFMVNHLHYPDYFNRFLGIAKVLGVIAILVPGFSRLKEWAYAGFTFDLIGAVYSLSSVNEPLKNMVLFPVFFLLLAGSYIYFRKRLKESNRL